MTYENRLILAKKYADADPKDKAVQPLAPLKLYYDEMVEKGEFDEQPEEPEEEGVE